MDIKNYAESLAEKIREENEDLEVEVQENLKNNDFKRVGLTIKKKGEQIAPNIYVDDMFKEGLSIDKAKEEALSLYEKFKVSPFDVEKLAAFLSDYEKVKENICIRVLGYEQNKENIKNCPYMIFGDLVCLFYIYIDAYETGDITGGSIKIHNDLCLKWNITLLELCEKAIENTRRMFPMKMKTMYDTLAEMRPGIEDLIEEQNPMMVVTNQTMSYGSSYILDKESLNEIADNINRNFYIIPSSIHEFIVLPEGFENRSPLFGEENVENPMKFMLDMVKEVNQYELPPSDKLTDNVYFYDKDKESLYDAEKNLIILP